MTSPQMPLNGLIHASKHNIQTKVFHSDFTASNSSKSSPFFQIPLLSISKATKPSSTSTNSKRIPNHSGLNIIHQKNIVIDIVKTTKQVEATR